MRTEKSAWIAFKSSKTRKRRGRPLALYGKAGRRLCQDVALLLDLAQLPAQFLQFLALALRQRRVVASSGRLNAPCVGTRLDHPVYFG